MRFYIFSFALILFFNQVFSQPGRFYEQRRSKIEEFKKIKLIEALDLTQEESERFFVIYNDHQKRMRNFQKDRERIIEQMNKLVRDESKFQERKFIELEQKLLSLEQEALKNRHDFYLAVKNILPAYKVAKFYVFERDFIIQLNRLLMERRNRNPKEE